MENIKLTLSAEDIDLFREYLSIAGSLAKNMEIKEVIGSKKVLKTYLDSERFLPDYRERVQKFDAMKLSNFCDNVLYKIDKEIQDENIKRGIEPRGFILK